MEGLVLNLQSKNQITDYIANKHFMPYATGIFKEMLNAIETSDQAQLDWFRSFGESFMEITMNVHAYRKGLEFGFTEISFDKYGWFTRPSFLDTKELTFGDTSRYGNHSLIYLGRGQNHIWTYGMNYSFGVAGGCYGLSVHGKQFKCGQETLSYALNELITMMTKKIGSTDTTNDKQPVILATLRDIEKAMLEMVQLTLF
ncbi:hypothetical protein [Mucilaginibacter gotjawali]|uniref:Uncharacterized protein n=2 Tax=Mucilaginibacter gotjawali TaxID=1550579 RepID=A0A0X8X5V2_9SPHI|nr:hypothetical protein [Mucilaginibacter gotjawali]MBB3058728.1 hypothetical protein [Mucilaginibacter gotjawali]BAU55667.1 hypothetical protein MgSA37_03858 [Mucilaginibacter gotjawali]